MKPYLTREIKMIISVKDDDHDDDDHDDDDHDEWIIKWRWSIFETEWTFMKIFCIINATIYFILYVSIIYSS